MQMDGSIFLETHATLCRFFSAFDKRDWASLGGCLAPEVFIDYSSSGRELPAIMTSDDFVSKRKGASDTLTKQHSFSNLQIAKSVENSELFVSCNYLILRFDLGNPNQTDNFFHSCGHYEFKLERDTTELKISSIKQLKLQSWGNKSLHAGSDPRSA
jgi:hypothetical protein